MKKITTIKELKQAISQFKDDDVVVVEIYEELNNGLYEFTIDEVVGMRFTDGTEISEVRISI